ncbi:MAG: NAD-dependent epimerase/dehydratase family protein [Clostridiales bacterium]|nr:NAD-dependent epimerase/dehydratase family protein [Clostridiales bacterium]
MSDEVLCEKLVEGCDMVINMAAVIPPRSDKDPDASYQCNQLGAMHLTDAISKMKNQAKFIHISTVALYGNRTLEHPWGRVGDPLLPSAFDPYAMHKLIGECYVLESNIKYKTVLRQTAMLYPEIIFANISDGLLYHTVLNGPLEWVTAKDSGTLIKNIVKAEIEGTNGVFWNNIYDISGGECNRRTGYDTFADGFKIMGGSPKAYVCPCECATRNFHGLWYADGAELEKSYHYRSESVDGFWTAIGKKYRAFKVAKILPAGLIRLFIFKRLLRDKNAPTRWIKDGDKAKVYAYMGGMQKVKSAPKKWDGVIVADRKQYGSEEISPETIYKDKLLNHGYNENKPVTEWDLEDMQGAAKYRGGKCLSSDMIKGAVHDKLLWQCSAGHTFYMKPFTVLKGGHWCPMCQPQPWSYDKLAKKSPFYAQVWYDSHDKDEDVCYWFDENWAAHMRQLTGDERL